MCPPVECSADNTIYITRVSEEADALSSVFDRIVNLLYIILHVLTMTQKLKLRIDDQVQYSSVNTYIKIFDMGTIADIYILHFGSDRMSVKFHHVQFHGEDFVSI